MLIDLKYSVLTWFYQNSEKWKTLRSKLLYKKLRNECASHIKQVDANPICDAPGEVRLFAIMRNESLRLPHFLEHYKKIGVDRFFLLDNDSTDNSLEIALSNESVHVFSSKEVYQKHWFWMEHLLEKYGRNYWCVVVDIDELLCFPHIEHVSIPHICRYLETEGSSALRSLLLDMYSTEKVKDIVYLPGHNPLNIISYFDTKYYEISFPYFDRSRWLFFDSVHFAGGMRERVFGKSKPITSLNKFPLFKFTPEIYLGQGMHAINGAKISEIRGVVFHTKFLSDFIQEAYEESLREQHFNNAAYYKDFKRTLDENPDLCLADVDSVSFKNSQQLIDLGLMKTTTQFEIFINAEILSSD